MLILAGEIHRQLRYVDLSDLAHDEQQPLRDVLLPPMNEPIRHIFSVACESSGNARLGAVQKNARDASCCLAMAAESGAIMIAYMRDQSLYWTTLKLPGKAPLRCICAAGSGIACVCSDGSFLVGLGYDDKGTPCLAAPQRLDMPRCACLLVCDCMLPVCWQASTYTCSLSDYVCVVFYLLLCFLE